jgi:hypothetical protein
MGALEKMALFAGVSSALVNTYACTGEVIDRLVKGAMPA